MIEGSANFGCLQVNEPPVRNSQEAFMMEMRAARMVRHLFPASVFDQILNKCVEVEEVVSNLIL